ncbi:MAG: ParB/RepB/Spo0J family partition protein, partial [Oscillospiraceae bacterium]
MANKFNMEFLKGQVDKSPQISEETLSKFKTASEIFDKTDQSIDILPLDKLLPYSKHPFKIRDGERLDELTESIKEQGILVPLIVRVHNEKRGYYEILAGHHRQIASQRAGLTDTPCIIKNVDDDIAAFIVVESNKQRGFADMLPSEIAKSLKLEYDALKCQGKRTDLLKELEDILSEQNADKCDNGGENESFGTVCQKTTGEKIGDKNSM